MGVWRTSALRGWRQTRRRAKAGVGTVGAQLLHVHLNGWIHVIGGPARGHDRGISERSTRKARVPLGSLAWIAGILSQTPAQECDFLTGVDLRGVRAITAGVDEIAELCLTDLVVKGLELSQLLLGERRDRLCLADSGGIRH